MTKLYSCYICKQKKPKEDFPLDRKRRNQIASRCNQCKGEYDNLRAKNRKDYFDRYKLNNQEKFKVQAIIKRALYHGKIHKEPCKICGNPKSYGHHDDYNKPLEVRWLCKHHHGEFHFG